jgi:hypothetical protein
MSTGSQSPDLGGPLKKTGMKEPGKVGLGGKALGGKLLGGGLGEASNAAPVAPAAPSAPINYELNESPEEPAPKKKAAAPAANFNPFDDVDVAAPSPIAPAPKAEAAPGTGRVAKSATGRVEKPATGRTEKPATDRTPKPPARDFGDNFDVAPGVAKDLWSCPHCGAKNKPQRETCRECSKHPDDPVEKAWYIKPKIIGPVAAGVIVLVYLIMILTRVDLSLRPAGIVDNSVRMSSVKEEVLDLDESRKIFVRHHVSVSGRVIMAKSYPMAPWMLAVALGLGPNANDDDAFSKWSAEISDTGVTVNAPRSTVVFLIFKEGEPKLKAGDYLSVKGKAGVPEQDAQVVRGTNVGDVHTILVDNFNAR